MCSLTYTLAVLCLLCLGYTTSVDDFSEERSHYTFIYHDQTNLLLIEHAEKCYFTDIPDNLEGYLEDKQFFFTNIRQGSEYYVISQISRNRQVEPSTLDAERDEFHDLLADFRCQGKAIYRFNWH